MNKELARLLGRARARAPKRKKEQKPETFSQPLDTWDPDTFREWTPTEPEEKVKAPQPTKKGETETRGAEKEPEISEAEPKKIKRGPVGKRLKTCTGIPALADKRKARKGNMNITVSAEERDILVDFANTIDMSFSSWAREALFAAMEKKVPPRS